MRKKVSFLKNYGQGRRSHGAAGAAAPVALAVQGQCGGNWLPFSARTALYLFSVGILDKLNCIKLYFKFITNYIKVVIIDLSPCYLSRLSRCDY